jgi:hypothetical protein
MDPEKGEKADMRLLRNGRSRCLWRTYLTDDRSRRQGSQWRMEDL